MSANNYMIIGVTPANNERNVDITTPIKIAFSTYMEASTINKSNIILRKINGETIDVHIEYINSTMVATVTPVTILDYGTDYEIFIVGGHEALLGITEEYMPESKIFRFTTSYDMQASAPQSVTVFVDNGYPTVSWPAPTYFDSAYDVSYEVMISTSSEPLVPPIWPTSGVSNTTTNLTFSIPTKLDSGKSYFAYVRVINGPTTSDWGFSQFYVEAPIIGGGSYGTPVTSSSFNLEILETYPNNGAQDVTPEKVILLFSENIDSSSIDANSVYIIPKIKNGALTAIDLLMDFSPSKAIQVSIDEMTSPTNALTITPLTGAVLDDTSYTVVVRETVKGISGNVLGEVYSFSFTSNYSRLYGDVDLVRHDIGKTVNNLSDSIIYKFLSDNSDQSYQLVSQTSNFTASDYEEGAAPYYVHQYVRYRTSYDLLLNAQLHMTSGGGGFTSSVKLGDLTVNKTADSSSDVSGVLIDLQTKIKFYLDLLHGHHNRGYAKPSTVSRGENVESYPSFLTRAEFHDLGS